MNPYSPPAELAAVLACLFFLLALANQAARLWYSMRGKPAPGEIAAASAALSERVGRMEVGTAACKIEQDRRLDSLERTQVELRTLLLSEMGAVYRKVNAVADSTATISGSLGVIQSNVNLILTRSREQ